MRNFLNTGVAGFDHMYDTERFSRFCHTTDDGKKVTIYVPKEWTQNRICTNGSSIKAEMIVTIDEQQRSVEVDFERAEREILRRGITGPALSSAQRLIIAELRNIRTEIARDRLHNETQIKPLLQTLATSVEDVLDAPEPIIYKLDVAEIKSPPQRKSARKASKKKATRKRARR